MDLDLDSLLGFERIFPVLYKTIGRKRFLHSMGAMHCAVVLALRNGEDVVRAATAGLLHDCGRLPEFKQVEAEAKRRRMEIPAEDRPHAKVWHALLSAHMAAHDYGIEDPAVLRAIRLHPTGDGETSSLDRIVFLADYIEPTRRFEGLNALRELAERDLNAAFRRAVEVKLLHIQSRGRALHPRSLRALEAVGGTLEGAGG